MKVAQAQLWIHKAAWAEVPTWDDELTMKVEQDV